MLLFIRLLVLPHQLQQYIGATDIVAPLVLVHTYGQNWHNCLHFEYHGAAMLAAPIIAYKDMFTMFDVYSLHLVRNGAENIKIFKKG
jgi:hypothetical protein